MALAEMTVDKVQVDDGADESQTINRYHLTYHIMSLISGQNMIPIPSPLFIKYSCSKNAIPFNSLDCYALFITGMGNINFRNQFSSQM